MASLINLPTGNDRAQADDSTPVINRGRMRVDGAVHDRSVPCARPARQFQLAETPSVAAVVEDRLRGRLRASPYVGLHNVECDYHEGTVTLRGQVASYFLKQVAQELVRSVRGIEEIANQISVVEGARDRQTRRSRDE